MKTFLWWFFAVLGFIFFWIIVGAIYFVVADPFNLRPLVNMLWQASESKTNPAPAQRVPAEPAAPLTTEPTDETGSQSVNQTPLQTATQSPGLNADQAAALDSVGLDANAASSITPEQEVCFVQILGQARVDAVKAGAVPSASEFFSVRGCI